MRKHKSKICSVAAIIGIIVFSSVNSDSNYPSAIGQTNIGGVSAGTLIVSERALEVIGNAEGCRLAPYKCPAGLKTDGIGNTHNVQDGIKTKAQIAVDWVRNIESAQDCLQQSTDLKLMTQGQIDAFTSFIFNTGCSRFRHNRDGSDTRIYKKIKRHNFTAACHELRFWVYGGGKKLPGLIKRRDKEKELCLAK